MSTLKTKKPSTEMVNRPTGQNKLPIALPGHEEEETPQPEAAAQLKKATPKDMTSLKTSSPE